MTGVEYQEFRDLVEAFQRESDRCDRRAKSASATEDEQARLSGKISEAHAFVYRYCARELDLVLRRTNSKK